MIILSVRLHSQVRERGRVRALVRNKRWKQMEYRVVRILWLNCTGISHPPPIYPYIQDSLVQIVYAMSMINFKNWMQLRCLEMPMRQSADKKELIYKLGLKWISFFIFSIRINDHYETSIIYRLWSSIYLLGLCYNRHLGFNLPQEIILNFVVAHTIFLC